jgi:hypothetical protein
MSDVAIVAHRAWTDDPETGALGPAGHGRWFMLDELAPRWREYPNWYLLWTIDDPDDMALPTAIKMMGQQGDSPPKILVALGREAAEALGVPVRFEWFTGYRVTVGPYPVMVIPIPAPHPMNRTMLNRERRATVTKLFNRLRDPEWIAATMEEP